MAWYANYTDERGPTWWEGYYACAAGWGLHEGATPAYVAGWRHRHKLEMAK